MDIGKGERHNLTNPLLFHREAANPDGTGLILCCGTQSEGNRPACILMGIRTQETSVLDSLTETFLMGWNYQSVRNMEGPSQVLATLMCLQTPPVHRIPLIVSEVI